MSMESSSSLWGEFESTQQTERAEGRVAGRESVTMGETPVRSGWRVRSWREVQPEVRTQGWVARIR